MTNEIRLSEFDDDTKSANTHPIKAIEDRIIETAPEGARIAFTFPGYVSILLSDGVEIAFGESLGDDTGYSWNDSLPDGTNRYSDSISDLGDVNLIVNKLWDQVAHLTNKEAK